MVKYLKTAHMTCLEKTNGGVFYLLPDIIIKICTLIPLIFLWRVVMSSGADVAMSMPQMLSYTYVSALLSDMMVVKTAASGWLSEGILMRLYGRPLSVLGQLIAQTAGGWLPMLVLFSLPMAMLAPLIGVSLQPASLWFFISLFLCISLGFAIDVLFACLGGAPLSIFVGAAEPSGILWLQTVWNLILWPAALLVFKKSQEGMVSYGG